MAIVMNPALANSRSKSRRRARFLQAVNLSDVGMIEGGQRLRFTREPRQAFHVAGDRLWQDLDGDLSIQPGIARAIHFAHAAGADRGEDLVRADSGAGERQGAAIIQDVQA